MTRVNARSVSPRRCIRPRSADLGAWGAKSAGYICEIFIFFLLMLIFSPQLLSLSPCYLQAHTRSLRQLAPSLLRRDVSCVPIRPVRVVLPVTLLVLAVGGCRAPHRACQIVC